jgi:hypothetical protein
MDSSGKWGTRVLYGLIVAVAVVATLFGVSNGRILGVTPAPKATPGPVAGADPVLAQPAPPLFKDADLLTVSTGLPFQAKRAETNIDDFYADQPTGSTVDDQAFGIWASRQVAAAPSAGARSLEKAKRDALNHSAARDVAARWLGVHGCHDVWTSYVVDQKRFHADDAVVARRSELTDVLDLAARVAAAAQKRRAAGSEVATQAPCSPRDAAANEACGCTYPSSVAAMSAAARTYLTALSPMAGPQYRWMEKQVDLTAVYQGYELPSDVTAGAYLGYLVGRYFVASRGYADLHPTPTPSTTARTS